MVNLCKYENYIKENFDYDFKVGETVIVVGEVDDRVFNKVKALISEMDKSDGEYETNMDVKGLCKRYYYTGTSYLITPIDGSYDWYVPKYNLRHIEPIEYKPVKIRWYKKGKFTND